MAKRRSKHPFHWDIYSALYDQLRAIAGSDDRRISPAVAKHIDEARHQLWEAWNRQAIEERAAEDLKRIPTADERTQAR